MSRPSTRSKNKRPRTSDNGCGTTSEIMRKIHKTGHIADDDLNMLYMVSKPVCQGCRVNTKDNPNCFCGLIPPPNGTRKYGLWQKTSEVVAMLGTDPSNDLRPSSDSPAGLTNLGATCYANSILQCLYMNKSFREGVFSTEPDILKQNPVLDQLGRLFAQLHASNKAYIDSAPFIQTLELDNDVQQDSHEFLTLLLSLLEGCLSRSNVPKARTVVQDLFRGSVSHVTTCIKCGKDSESSSKMEDFYGLELNIKGLKSLDQSLKDYLSVEDLHGDNQYFCESCGTRVNATRCIKLRSLPDVLNFQLKRCVFFSKTTTKKKITSAFSFPETLDMGQMISEPASESELIYDLSAVLIHKGTAVNSGHYIAHIKDENTGKWWEFDDETVSNLGRHQFEEVASVSSSETPILNPALVNGDHQSTSSDSRTFSSSDAYMLMYKLRRQNMETESVESISLPFHLCEEIKELNESYLDTCQQYKVKKERKLDSIMERRHEVRSLLSEAPVSSIDDPYFWISIDWLRQWSDNIIPIAIDNTPIQCVHGKVPVSKVCSIKRLSAKVWSTLFSKYNGGPTLSDDDRCIDCLLTGAHTMVSADSYRDQRTSMREVAEAALAGKFQDDDGPFYYVSKTWLQQWVRRKNMDSPCEADTGPTAAIKCPHGRLMPEVAAGAKRLLIPETLWLFLYHTSDKIKPEDTLGCSTFPSDSLPCDECSVELTEVASLEDALREQKLRQRQNHEKLALGKSITLSLDCNYYLVPSSWLSKWRSYINVNGKNVTSAVEPETLSVIIDSLKCEKHSMLLERPLDLIYKRRLISQKFSTTDGLTMISEDDWRLFCEEWGGVEEKGICGRIEYSEGVKKSMEEVEICDEDYYVSPNEEGNEEEMELVVKSCPELCEECIGERESCELVQKLNYRDENIHVCFVRDGKEPPRSVLEASSTNDRRTSKRCRRTSLGKTISLKVSGSTTMYQLKMMIWGSFEIVKENQSIHKGSSVVEGDESATLSELHIFPSDVLWVTDSGLHEYRDIADELSDNKLEVKQTEEGFRGTLLLNNSSQVV